MLLVFLLLGAAGSLALCLHAGWGGLGFALRFVLLTLAGFLAAVLVYVLLLTLILLFTDGKKEVTGDRQSWLLYSLACCISRALW